MKAKPGYKLVKSLFGKYDEIPEEWNMVKSSGIVKLTMGQSPPSESYNDEENGLPFYQGVTDFGNLYPNTSLWCTDPKKIAEDNTILFSVRAPVAEMNLTNTKCCLGRGVASFNPQKNDLLYCFYLINQNVNRFLVYAQGTTYDAINKDDIEKTNLPFTSNILEQKKISSILSNMDDLILYFDNSMELTQKLKKDLMQTLLTRGIGHKKFKKFDTTRTKSYNIPEIWNIFKFGNIVKFLGGYAFSSADYVENGIQLLRQGNLYNRELYLQKDPIFLDKSFESKYSDYILKSKDIVISLTGTMSKRDYGYAILIPQKSQKLFLNQRIAKITPDKNILPEFLTYCMNHRYFEDQFYRLEAGTKQANVSLRDVKKINIFVPSIEEQEKIIMILSKIDYKWMELKTKKSNLEIIKKGLMQKLLTGQIRVKV